MMGDKAVLKEVVDLTSVSMAKVFETLLCDTNGLSTKAAEERISIFGHNIVEKQKRKLLEHVWDPFSLVMAAAAIMSITLANGGGKPPEWQTFVGIVLLLKFKSKVNIIAENKASNASAALINSLSPKTKVRRDGKWVELNASVLVPGDIISIKQGCIIPADVRLLEVDIPLKIDKYSLPSSGDIVYCGSTCSQGESEAVVIFTGVHASYNGNGFDRSSSRFGKALTEIREFCLLFILIVMFVEIVACAILEREYRAIVTNVLVLVIGGTPIAMQTVLSVILSTWSHRLSQQGAIIKRISAYEEMAGMDVLCVDNTGTLTMNKLSADRNHIEVFAENVEPDDVVLMAARASRLENQDAVDAAIVGMLADPKEARAGIQEVDFLPFNTTNKRTALTYTDNEGKMHRVSKGAPKQILNLVHNKTEIESNVHFVIDKYAERGLQSLAVAYQEVPEGKKESPGDPWKFIGLILLFDPPRHDSAETIRRAMQLGVDVKIITGDALAIVKETGRRLGMDTKKIYSLPGNYSNYEDIIEKADGLVGVSPVCKHMFVKYFKRRNHICGMTGDLVDDVQALNGADISIAIANATDAVRKASDIVLTEPGLSVIINAILTSRSVLQRVKNYTIYALSNSVFIVLSFSLLVNVWQFDFSPFMVLIIVILNSGAVIINSRDRVKPSPQPYRLKLSEIFTPGIILGVYLAIMTIFFFWSAYETHFFPTVFKVTSLHKKDVKDFRMLASAVYLQVSTMSQALIFVTRSRGWSYTERPGAFLMGAFVVTQMISTLIAVYANWGFAFIQGIGWRWAGVIWLYNLILHILLDPLKLLVRNILSEKKSKREKLQLKWAHAQRALHGVDPPETGFTDEEFNRLVEDAEFKPY